MDGADVTPAEMAAVLHDLAQVNALTLARRPTLAWLRRTLAGARRPLLIVDVGSGEGDMLRAIAARLPRWGVTAELVGFDLDQRCTAAARVACDGLGIDFVTGDAIAEVTRADIVLCSLVTHHMRDDGVVAFLRWADRVAARGWFVNDLRRHRVAYLGFAALAALARWHPIVRHDGALSVARAFTAADWAHLLARAGVAARVERWFPFRLCVAGDRA